jgi:DNA-directed RNA polymerase subunit RPC12/RpoP
VENSKLKFRCPNCAQKITAPADRGGKVGRCPRCKGKITVPRPVEPESRADATPKILTLIDPPPLLVTETPRPSERARLEAEHANAASQNNDELLTSLGIEPKTRYAGERQMVWCLDILLYPTSVSGLTTLGIVVGTSLFLPLINWIPFMGLVAVVIMGLYIGWYLAECVYDSACGGTRAPQLPTPGLGDMWSRVSYFLAVYVLFLFPPGLYYLFTRELDFVFYGLVVWTVLFFPMGLLAMAIMDSTTALNPFVLLGGILRTFFSYAAFLIFLVVVTFLMGWLWKLFAGIGPSFLRILVAQAGGFYTAMVQAHILGRFYWRNRERLDWGT